jgi:hypothetical protein
VSAASTMSSVNNGGLLSNESKTALGKIHQNLLMAAEETFDYLITGDKKSKQQFLEEYSSLAEEKNAFAKTFDLNATSSSEVKTNYDKLILATDAMEKDAGKLFSSFDTNKNVSLKDVTNFENDVDTATTNLNAIWKLNNPKGDNQMSVNGTRSYLNTILLEFIEESYAYPILGDKLEKEDALNKSAEFDKIVTAGEKQYPGESFEDLKTIKADLLKNAEIMFTTFEKEKTVKADEFATFDKTVDSFDNNL